MTDTEALIARVVAEQAEDEGLWAESGTAPEAYLQQALRRLHAAAEGDADVVDELDPNRWPTRSQT